MSETELQANALHDRLYALSFEDLKRMAVNIGICPEQEKSVLLARVWEVMSDRLYTEQNDDDRAAEAQEVHNETTEEEIGDDDADGSDTETVKADEREREQE
ncbi:hypothetical protein FRB90_005355 [Tulasnella sp. 427]|nr:hypothetical protein FRB90_005355 [Tulasnella sp. 427]